MPVLLTDIQATAAAAAKIYNPKFFDSKLTGRGGTAPGYLSDRNCPRAVLPDVKTSSSDNITLRRSYKSGQTTYTVVPMNPLTTQAESRMEKLTRPDWSELTKIASIGGRHPMDCHIRMQAQTVSIEDTTVQDYMNPGQPSTTVHTFRMNYVITLFFTKDANDPVYKHSHSNSAHLYGTSMNQNTYVNLYSTNPLQELQFDMADQLRQDGWKVDQLMLNDFLINYDVYDAVCSRSEEWQISIDKTLGAYFEDMGKLYQNNSYILEEVKDEVKYIMTYNIPLDLYKPIYASITKHFGQSDANLICKQNLNLLLSDTLGNLNANKSQIPGFTPPANNVLPASIQKLSREQIAAVTSTEPLVLVQAGAGTGKSTLILGRIDYLVHAGVDPADITVLSFTNAAADNIKEKNPNVHSMTIARMIHEIYTENFTSHNLSTLDTIINTLDIAYPQVPGGNRGIVTDFQKKLKAMAKNDTNNFTEMNNFIEEHYDEVIHILDTINQTALELEIIICYQKIDTFKEPASIKSKYLIIDEVQDNSIFEFVYTLKYVDKHRESLFIVGDCSQTLYEFRASNPRALNILEGSNTFATYQLNVNYRSNQEILDFANIALQNIEANQYARIQLQANSLAQVTEQSFLDHVWFNYHQLNRLTDWYQALPQIFSVEVRPYIEACMQRKEPVTILAFTRRDIARIKDILQQQYPQSTCVSLVPEKPYSSTIMTTFIKKYWNDIKFAPYTNVINIIRQEIMSRLQFLTYDAAKSAPAIQNVLNSWASSEYGTIQAWINQTTAGQMTQAELLENVKKNMIDYEIRTNAIKQSLCSAENQRIKQENANAQVDFILSTIHSAKGLEFQNVIILYQNKNNMEEDKKRMYYVAFTRAMQTEYILAYDTMSSPQIQADYITVLEHLHAIAPAANSPIDQLAKKRRKRIKI